MKKSKKKKLIAEAKPALAAKKEQQKYLIWLGVVVAVIAIVQYAQTITYGFALDDYSAIIENHVTTNGIHAIQTIFKTTYRFGYPIQGDELYRPIPKSIFAILWSVFGENAMPFHLFNVLLYALTGFLLFTTLCKFLPDKIYLSFAASVLFIAHPIHAEVVANIKSVDEILSFLFFIISLSTLYKYLSDGKIKWLLLTLVLFFAALMSKESSITFLVVYPMVIFFFTKNTLRKIWSTTAWLLIPVLIFLLIRSRIVGAYSYPSMADNMLFATKDILERKATAIYILGLNLKLLVFPSQLTFDYSLKQISIVGIGDWKFIISFAVYAALFIYALINLKRKSLLAFGILFFFITISISSNIFIYIGTHMAERLIYVPSFGFCFAVAFLIDYFLKERLIDKTETVKAFFISHKKASAVLLIVVVLFSIKSVSQNKIWQNNLTLYESGIIASPESHRTHYYLGNYLLKKDYLAALKEPEKSKVVSRAFNELRKSVEIYPGMSDVWLQMGNYFSNTDKKDSAIWYLKKAIEVQPSLATAHNNLGAVYFGQLDLNKAIEELRIAIKLDPAYHDAYKNLGSAIATAGKFEEAIQYFKNALEIDPNNAETNYYLAITYESMGNMKMKKFYMDKASALDPQYK
ncbi:MAG: tetratricopeptide repeat protein [Chitinophagales bacterium]|nr:tetratricopeptide repeat protein [Chitinophagales bacterium]